LKASKAQRHVETDTWQQRPGSLGGAAIVELTPDDRRAIEDAGQITIQGARYPEELERRIKL
jgi:hypothetical protein